MKRLNNIGPKTEPWEHPFLGVATHWSSSRRALAAVSHIDTTRWVHRIFRKLRMLLVWPQWVGGAGSRTPYLGPWRPLPHAYVSPAPHSNHQWVSTVHLGNCTPVCRRLFSGRVSPEEIGSSDGERFFREPSTLMVGCSQVCSCSCWDYRLFCSRVQPLPV